jgi:hypothetical protein
VIPEAGRAFVCYDDREGARVAKEQAINKVFKGKHLFISYCEPKELRQVHIEEMMDKKAYETMKSKQIMQQKILPNNMTLE